MYRRCLGRWCSRNKAAFLSFHCAQEDILKYADIVEGSGALCGDLGKLRAEGGSRSHSKFDVRSVLRLETPCYSSGMGGFPHPSDAKNEYVRQVSRHREP